MFLDKLLAILLQLKGGVLALVLATGTAVTVTGTIGDELIDLTITPVGATTASTMTLTSTLSENTTTTTTSTKTSEGTTSTTTATLTTDGDGNCSNEAHDRNAAFDVLGDAHQEVADLFRIAGAVALANGAENNKMREMLKEYGHDAREILKDALHDVHDLGKRILGDCGEDSTEGLVSRIEHEFDEVAEVHEEFERGRGNGSGPFVVTVSEGTANLVAPYRERVEEAIEELEALLDDLAEDIR